MSHMDELRKVGNTSLCIDGMKGYDGKFYVLGSSMASIRDKIFRAAKDNPEINRNAIPLPLDRIEHFIITKYPIIIDADVFNDILRNVFSEFNTILENQEVHDNRRPRFV